MSKLESYTFKVKKVKSCKGKWKIRVAMQCVTGKNPPINTVKVETKTFTPSRKEVRFGVTVNKNWKSCG